MGDLVRLLSPKREAFYRNAAKAAKDTIYASVHEGGRRAHCEEVTIALARAVYECFYQMQDAGLKPPFICEEIDGFMDLMQQNLPKIKSNVWNWEKENNL